MRILRREKITLGVVACLCLLLCITYFILRKKAIHDPQLSQDQRQALAMGQFIMTAERQYDSALDALIGLYRPFVTNTTPEFWNEFRERERTNVAFIARALLDASSINASDGSGNPSTMDEARKEGYNAGTTLAHRLNENLVFELQKAGYLMQQDLDKVNAALRLEGKSPGQSLKSGMK